MMSRLGVYSLRQNTRTWQTDGRTDTAWRHRPRLCIASRDKKTLGCTWFHPSFTLVTLRIRGFFCDDALYDIYIYVRPTSRLHQSRLNLKSYSIQMDWEWCLHQASKSVFSLLWHWPLTSPEVDHFMPLSPDHSAPILRLIHNLGVNYHQYADDTQLYTKLDVPVTASLASAVRYSITCLVRSEWIATESWQFWS